MTVKELQDRLQLFDEAAEIRIVGTNLRNKPLQAVLYFPGNAVYLFPFEEPVQVAGPWKSKQS